MAKTAPTSPAQHHQSPTAIATPVRTYERSFAPWAKVSVSEQRGRAAPRSPHLPFQCEYSATVLADSLAHHYSAAEYDTEQLADTALLKLIRSIDPNQIYFTPAEISRLMDDYDSSLYQHLLQQGACAHIIALQTQLKTMIKERTDELISAIMRQPQPHHSHGAERPSSAFGPETFLPLYDWPLDASLAAAQQSYLRRWLNTFPEFSSQPFELRQLVERDARPYIDMQTSEFLFWFTAAHVAALDQHSRLLDINEATLLYGSTLTQSRPNVPLGLRLTRDVRGYIKIKEIIPLSSAERAGRFQVGDLIYAVSHDDHHWLPTPTMPIKSMRNWLIGPIGETIYLKLLRLKPQTLNHYELIPVAIKRKVHAQALTDPENNQPSSLPLPRTIFTQQPDEMLPPVRVGYVIIEPLLIHPFDDAQLADYLAATIAELTTADAQVILLDLRHHLGGQLASHLDLIQLFTQTTSPLLHTSSLSHHQGDPKYHHQSLVSDKVFVDMEQALTIPVVIMVSENTASSAEAFTGSLMQHGRALVIGASSTAGKGTIQTFRGLTLPFIPFTHYEQRDASFAPKNDASAYDEVGIQALTTGQYFLPDGTAVHGQGLTAHIPLLTYSLLFKKSSADPANPAPAKDLPHSHFPLDVPDLLELGFQDPALVHHLSTIYQSYVQRENRPALASSAMTMIEQFKVIKSHIATRTDFMSMQPAGEAVSTHLINTDRELADAVFISAHYYNACRHGFDPLAAEQPAVQSYAHHLGCVGSMRVMASSPSP